MPTQFASLCVYACCCVRVLGASNGRVWVRCSRSYTFSEHSIKWHREYFDGLEFIMFRNASLVCSVKTFKVHFSVFSRAEQPELSTFILKGVYFLFISLWTCLVLLFHGNDWSIARNCVENCRKFHLFSLVKYANEWKLGIIHSYHDCETCVSFTYFRWIQLNLSAE